MQLKWPFVDSQERLRGELANMETKHLALVTPEKRGGYVMNIAEHQPVDIHHCKSPIFFNLKHFGK